MSIRKDFIGLTSSFSRFLPLDILCRLTGQDFIIPFYHVVSDEDCPHISNLYRYKSMKEFERDIDYLASHYEPIGPERLQDVLAGKHRGKKIMLLTFDDGLRQMYDVVAPILLRKGIPAIFFLNTDFIDNKGLMFRYKASLALKMDYDRYYSLYDHRSDAELTADIGHDLDLVFDRFLKEYKPYMTSTQIQTLLAQGFAIGGHSCSHPYYEDLSMDEQLSQTYGCLEVLINNFGIKDKLFAFPFADFGVSKAFFDTIFDSGKVDFSFGGAGIKKDVHPRQLQRIPVEGWNESEQVLKAEYLYYLLRMPFFKSRINRK